MKKLIVLLMSLILLVGCGQKDDFGTIEYTNSVDIETKAADMTLYANMPLTGHPFEETTLESILSLIEGGGTGAIFFGSPTCGACNLAVPVLSDAANEMNVKIYYVETSGFSDESYDKFLEIAGDFVAQDDGSAGLFTPNLFIVKNGEMIANYLGLPDSYSGGSMTESQIEDLTHEYQTLINELED